MKISNKLPQFKDRETLLIVAGFFNCKFFIINDGNISEKNSLKIEEPTYSDREEFFVKQKGGDLFISGSVYESKKTLTRKRFLGKIEKNTKTLIEENNVKQIYLFAPPEIISEFNNTVSKPIKNLTQKPLKGNYTKLHPFNLLKKLKEKMGKESVTPMTEEAKKLLEKGAEQNK